MAELKRELGLFDVTMAGVGIIMGAGIYALIGVAAKSSGNATWIAFLISAIVALFTGLSYAELSSMFKGDAGEFDYIKTTISRKFAYFVAIIMIFGTIISTGAVALGFARYFTSLVPIPVVAAAILLILLMTLINFIGIKETSWFNSFSATVEVIGLALIIILGFLNFGKGNINYFEMPMGWSGVFSSAALVFFAFLGFESLIKLREETKDPDKTIPKGIILSVIITSIIYVLVALSAVTALGWQALSQSKAPLAAVAAASFGSYAFTILAIIALFSTANTVLITMVASSRQLYGMARERALPTSLGAIYKKTETPWVAILFTMVVAMFFALMGNIEIVANLTDLFLFIAFASVNLSLIILRYKLPDKARGFRCPVNIGKFSVTAMLGVLTSLGMIFFVLRNLL